MHELYELKDMLLEKLKEYGKKGELTSSTLEVVDKLSRTVKNLCRIIEEYEAEEYSGEYRNRDGNSSYERSYARGRGRGRSSREGMSRYSREQYSRAGDMVQELRELMEDAPDEQTRKEFQRFIQKMEQM